jgi:hypothetical protein
MDYYNTLEPTKYSYGALVLKIKEEVTVVA